MRSYPQQTFARTSESVISKNIAGTSRQIETRGSTIPDAILRSVSGRLHPYDVCRPQQVFSAGPAVYCCARPGPAGRGWTPLFMSRTGNLAKRLAGHEQWEEAQLLGATHILVHQQDERDVREYVEADLAGSLRPVMNGPFLDAELEEAASEAGVRLVWAA